MTLIRLFRCTTLIVLLSFGLGHTNAQNCRIDSATVLVHHGYYNGFFNGNASYDNYCTINYFDLDSGLALDAAGQVIGFWKKSDTLFDGNGRIHEVLVKIGSVSGWQNYSSTTYSYHTNGEVLCQVDKSWNGLNWDTLTYHYRDYDVNGLLILDSYLQSDSMGLGNVRKVEVVRSGALPLRKFIYRGNGSTWTNDTLFEFYYQGNLRDSLAVSAWDTSSSSWFFVAGSPYDSSYGSWVAFIQGPDSFFVSAPTIPKFTSVLVLDTNEFYVRRYFLQVDTFSSAYNFKARDDEYGYLNDSWRLIRHGSEVDYMGCEWDGTFWYYIMDSTSYSYDSIGNVVRISGFRNHGSHGGGPYYKAMSYDLNGNLSHVTYEFEGGVYSYTYYTEDYSYHNSAQLNIIALEDTIYPFACPSEMDNISFVVIGGCAPYHYQWSPSLNLSSDTVRYPQYYGNDTASYTLTVSDDYGRQSTCNIVFTPVIISVDSSSAPATYSLSAFCETSVFLNSIQEIEWFYEGASISYTNECSLSVALPGHYSCRLAMPNGCYLVSDTVLINSNPIIYNQAPQICQGDSFMLPDGTNAYYPGNYFTRLSTPLLQDSVVITQLTVNPTNEMFTYETTCAYFPDTIVTIFTFSNQFGCDSVVTHTHYIYPEYNSTFSATFCRGDSLLLPDGMYVSQDGLYTIDLQTQQGCDSIIEYQIQSIYPNVSSIIEINDTLFVTSTSVSFDWYRDGVYIGSTTQGYFPTLSSGFYEVVAFDSLGCSSDRVGINYVLGSHENSGHSNFDLFPNPVNDLLTIHSVDNQLSTISVFDAFGRCVKTTDISGGSSHSIVVSELSNGCYLLVLVSADGKRYRDEFVIQH